MRPPLAADDGHAAPDDYHAAADNDDAVLEAGGAPSS